MIRSVFNKQSRKALAGIALGLGAGSYYYSRPQAALVRAEGSPPVALSDSKWTSFKVAATDYVSPDTKEITLKLPDGYRLGGKTAFTVLFQAVDKDGSNVIRPYTPVSSADTIGSATFVIKGYPKGAMSQHMHALKVGESVELMGPISEFQVDQNQFKEIGLIGGGSGITPLFQILQRVADDPDDKTKVDLFYASKTFNDILLKKEIDELISKKPDQLKVTYFLSAPTRDWKGEKGFITEHFLEDNLFSPKEKDVMVFVCGPPGLVETLAGAKDDFTSQGELSGALRDLGFNEDQVFKF